jgi:arylsulfatase A-like enzyme
MKKTSLIFYSIFLAACLPLAAKQPNFVVVLGEGHGWSSTSVQMDDAVPASKSADVSTPNLESLAQGGMRFANFYAASPRCTPSRAAIFTGKSPAALNMTFVGEGKADNRGAANGKVIPPDCSIELPTGETTIAEFLKANGYATAHFGNWHVGRTEPSIHGFDESDGPTNNGGPENVPNPHPKQLFGMTERGMDFMAREVKEGKPFYLQMSHYAFRHAEGGRREAKDAGKAGEGEDIFPTIAALASIKQALPKGIEGGSLAPVLRNGGKGAVQRPNEDFVVHFPHYDKDSSGPASALFPGDAGAPPVAHSYAIRPQQ